MLERAVTPRIKEAESDASSLRFDVVHAVIHRVPTGWRVDAIAGVSPDQGLSPLAQKVFFATLSGVDRDQVVEAPAKNPTVDTPPQSHEVF